MCLGGDEGGEQGVQGRLRVHVCMHESSAMKVSQYAGEEKASNLKCLFQSENSNIRIQHDNCILSL